MAKAKAKQSEDTYVVLSEFRDINDFSKAYNVGDEIGELDEKRAKDLLERGLIGKPGEEAPTGDDK